MTINFIITLSVTKTGKKGNQFFIFLLLHGSRFFFRFLDSFSSFLAAADARSTASSEKRSINTHVFAKIRKQKLSMYIKCSHFRV